MKWVTDSVQSDRKIAEETRYFMVFLIEDYQGYPWVYFYFQA